MTTVTIEQLRSAVNEIDGLAREGFSEIAATARLALAAMENPRTCNDLDTFAAAFEAIAGRAGDIEDCIGRAAEIVGCDSVDEHQNRRWNAREQSREAARRELGANAGV
ncbi:MAG: hypothetical protein OJF60_002941 [Burkholderiaceae bacterium]|jgi:hypothetical protein|nr:MAG: hypothetical protein OJF60_002941 [Burkholderiaceae bacterium]